MSNRSPSNQPQDSRLRGRDEATLVTALLDDRDTITITLSGASMWPTFPEKARVRMRKARVADVAIGDVLVFHYQERIIAHRFLATVPPGEEGEPPLLVARGDHCPRLDAPFRAEQLLARIEAVEIDGSWTRSSDLVAPATSRIVSSVLLKLEGIRKLVPRSVLTRVRRPLWGIVSCFLRMASGSPGTGRRGESR